MLRLWHPEVFQGRWKHRRYFEGYYAKHVTGDLSESWSFILAVSHGDSRGEDSSFIQVIEGATGRTWWFEGGVDAFEGDTSHFRIRVGATEISYEGATIDVGEGEDRFLGEIRYDSPLRIKASLFSPGVMGWYGLIPFMECKHGLVSLDHGLKGGFSHGGRFVSLDGGRGYIEKDWGSSMPSSWIWAQSNNFPEAGDSFMFSVARIPWLGRSFVGFLCVASLGGRLIRMATYTGARIVSLQADDESVSIEIAKGDERLCVSVKRARGGILRAPVNGNLTRRIAESVDAVLRLSWERQGTLLFDGIAPKAGLEVTGDPRELLP